MIHFNELRYSKDNKYLVIDVAIDNLDYYDNVVIDSIIIDNLDTFVANGPSSSPIYTYNVPEVYSKTYTTTGECNCSPVMIKEDESYCFNDSLDNMRHIRLELPLNTLKVNYSSDILFVYVTATGTPATDTPCGFDNSKIIGTVVDLQGFYNNMLSYIRLIKDGCAIPKEFIDAILRFKAVEVWTKTGNYPLIVKYWKKLFPRKTDISTTKTCKCYG